jgi:Ca2+-binding EF-hand superfamily protein
LLANKNDEWRRDDTTNTQLIEMYDKALQRLELGPVPSIKREEFAKFARRSLVPGAPTNQGAADYNDDADKVFRVLDKNADGELETEELTLNLKEDKVRSDADGNGRVSKEEYRDYFKKKVAARAEALAVKFGRDPLARTEGKSDGKPVAGKAGSLPEWFTTLDADKDGQVSLFEWRDGDKPTEVFREMDLDGDSLLTKDEYLRYLKKRAIELDQKRREEGK